MVKPTVANQPTTPKQPPTLQEIEDRALDLDSRSLEEQAQEELDEGILRKVKKIAYYTSENGLDLEEACILADVDVKGFKALMEATPLVGKIVAMKQLQYKKDLLYTISRKAQQGDDKLAMWLLERRFPEEFYASKRTVPGSGERSDPLAEAIAFIQIHGDSSPLVSGKTIKAVVIKKPKLEMLQKLKGILS